MSGDTLTQRAKAQAASAQPKILAPELEPLLKKFECYTNVSVAAALR